MQKKAVLHVVKKQHMQNGQKVYGDTPNPSKTSSTAAAFTIQNADCSGNICTNCSYISSFSNSRLVIVVSKLIKTPRQRGFPVKRLSIPAPSGTLASR